MCLSALLQLLSLKHIIIAPIVKDSCDFYFFAITALMLLNVPFVRIYVDHQSHTELITVIVHGILCSTKIYVGYG